MSEQEQNPETQERWLDPDLEALEEILEQAWDDGAMSLEELDGFFTALLCSPELIPQSEYLPEVLGPGDALENEEIFPNPEAAKLFWELVLHHQVLVGEALDSEEPFAPLLQTDEDGNTFGNEWAIGFLRAVDMRVEAWSEIQNDEDKFAWLDPILALAHENDPDPELRSSEGPIPDPLREALIAEIAGSVKELYRYFAPHRHRRVN